MKTKVCLTIFLCFCMFLSVEPATRLRNKRQTRPNINLDRCFQHWKSTVNEQVSDTKTSMASVMDQLENLGKSEDANRRIAEELERYFDAAYSPDAEPTNDQCERQLQQNWDNIMKSISDALDALQKTVDNYHQEIANAFNSWLQSVQNWFNKYLGNRG